MPTCNRKETLVTEPQQATYLMHYRGCNMDLQIAFILYNLNRTFDFR